MGSSRPPDPGPIGNRSQRPLARAARVVWALCCWGGALVSLALLAYFGPGSGPYSSEGGEAFVVVAGAALSVLAAGLATWAALDRDRKRTLAASAACAALALVLWTFA